MRTRLQFCRTCDSARTFEKPVVQHGTHLVLTVVSFGLWGVCWLALSIKSFTAPWQCRKCRIIAELNDSGPLISARKVAPDGFGEA